MFSLDQMLDADEARAKVNKLLDFISRGIYRAANDASQCECTLTTVNR